MSQVYNYHNLGGLTPPPLYSFCTILYCCFPPIRPPTQSIAFSPSRQSSDKNCMSWSSCCQSGFGSIRTTFRDLSRAAVKSAASKMRSAGLLPVRVDWARRATVCERCPLRVIRCGVSYCGKPFLHQVSRRPDSDGCGCPTREKARSPEEHCPLNPQNRAAVTSPRACDCKWCSL